MSITHITLPGTSQTVDLTSREGRNIACDWMATKLGMEIGLTSPDFFYDRLCEYWVLSGARNERGFWNKGQIHHFAVLEPGCDPTTASDWTLLGPELPLDSSKGIEALRLCILAIAANG